MLNALTAQIVWHEVWLDAAVLGLCGLVFVSPLVAWPIGWLWCRWRGRKRNEDRPLPRVARWLAAELCLLSLLFLVALPMAVPRDEQRWAEGMPLAVRAILVVPWVITALAGVVIVLSVMAWRHDYWSRTVRWHYTVIAVAGVIFVGWLYHVYLLGFAFL